MSELYKGVFWIPDIENLNSGEFIFRIPVTPEGDVIDPDKLDLNSRNAANYNHKLLWASLPSKVTHKKPYNYYPRGRVEIKRKKATIYLNPHIATEEVLDLLIDRFGLIGANGITKVVMNVDGSEHYKCYLD